MDWRKLKIIDNRIYTVGDFHLSYIFSTDTLQSVRRKAENGPDYLQMRNQSIWKGEEKDINFVKSYCLHLLSQCEFHHHPMIPLLKLLHRRHRLKRKVDQLHLLRQYIIQMLQSQFFLLMVCLPNYSGHIVWWVNVLFYCVH